MPQLSRSPPILARRTVASAPELVERLPDGRLRCYSCGHRCPIPEGREGVCRVRYNEGGVLRVPWGYVGALQCDPIEKKPFFHALPGTDALSFGMLGCDLHCGYCQNWFTSQSIRDPNAVGRPRDITPETLADLALESGAPTVVSTYNEPLDHLRVGRRDLPRGEAPRASDRLRLQRQRHSSGPRLHPALDRLLQGGPEVDGRQALPRARRGSRNVLDSIRGIYERGIWLEVLTLVIPGFNDSDEELREAARFIASVSPDIPWHVTAFHPDYKMTDRGATPASRLVSAAEIGAAEDCATSTPATSRGASESGRTPAARTAAGR